MMEETLLITCIVTAIGSCGATWVARKSALHYAVLDIPNDRSSHSSPTPRVGGVAVILSALTASAITGALPPSIYIAAVVLAGLSFIDDIITLPVLPRMLVQAIVVFFVSTFAVTTVDILPIHLPAYLAVGIVGLGWLWFINLYNFMDGIDGITSVETLSICIGIICIGLIEPAAEHLIAPAAILAAAMLGFAWWNWSPAKIFLGDVGSITLGFLCGYLLLSLAAAGELVAALLLSGYYLADATITLIRRALRGDKIWQAHKEHFYQRAYQNGFSHREICIRIFILNVLLIGCAVATLYGFKAWAFFGGSLIILFTLMYSSAVFNKNDNSL